MLDKYYLQIAFAILFISMIISRFMVLNAIKKLGEEDKAKLLSANLISNSQTRMLLMFAGLGAYYFAVTKFPEYAKELLIGFAVTFIAVRVITFANLKKKMQALALPEWYIKTYANSSSVYNFGILVFFLLLIKDNL